MLNRTTATRRCRGSLHGLFGDFGRYVVEPAIRKFATPDQKPFQSLVERAIFTRVLELGWTPERFSAVDQGRGGMGSDGPVERYGKKYQWIGLHEVLGRATDNHKLREPWGRKQPDFDYAYPEQILYRDIDPTVLVHGGLEDPIDNPSVRTNSGDVSRQCRRGTPATQTASPIHSTSSCSGPLTTSTGCR